MRGEVVENVRGEVVENVRGEVENVKGEDRWWRM